MPTRSTRLPGSTETSSKPKLPVSLFVNFLKTHRFLKADSPRFGRRDEAKIANEEDPVLVDCFFFDALQFAGKKG